MFRWKLAALALAALGLLFALWWNGRPAENPAAAGLPGYSVYRAHCRRCHGAWGDAAKATRLARRPVDIAAPAFRDTTTLEDLRRIVLVGRGRMEGFEGKLTPLEVDSVSRFVRVLPGR